MVNSTEHATTISPTKNNNQIDGYHGFDMYSPPTLTDDTIYESSYSNWDNNFTELQPTTTNLPTQSTHDSTKQVSTIYPSQELNTSYGNVDFVIDNPIVINSCSNVQDSYAPVDTTAGAPIDTTAVATAEKFNNEIETTMCSKIKSICNSCNNSNNTKTVKKDKSFIDFIKNNIYEIILVLLIFGIIYVLL